MIAVSSMYDWKIIRILVMPMKDPRDKTKALAEISKKNIEYFTRRESKLEFNIMDNVACHKNLGD
jgi:hypothetical protein